MKESKDATRWVRCNHCKSEWQMNLWRHRYMAEETEIVEWEPVAGEEVCPECNQAFDFAPVGNIEVVK